MKQLNPENRYKPNKRNKQPTIRIDFGRFVPITPQYKSAIKLRVPCTIVPCGY